MQLFIRKLIDNQKEAQTQDKKKQKELNKQKKQTAETMELDPDLREMQ